MRGELDATKLARLLQLIPILTGIFNKSQCLASVAEGNSAIQPPVRHDSGLGPGLNCDSASSQPLVQQLDSAPLLPLSPFRRTAEFSSVDKDGGRGGSNKAMNGETELTSSGPSVYTTPLQSPNQSFYRKGNTSPIVSLPLNSTTQKSREDLTKDFTSFLIRQQREIVGENVITDFGEENDISLGELLQLAASDNAELLSEGINTNTDSGKFRVKLTGSEDDIDGHLEFVGDVGGNYEDSDQSASDRGSSTAPVLDTFNGQCESSIPVTFNPLMAKDDQPSVVIDALAVGTDSSTLLSEIGPLPSVNLPHSNDTKVSMTYFL